MSTNWKKLKREVPEFEKPVVVKTEKNVYFVATLVSILTSKHGMSCQWTSLNDIDISSFEKQYGKVIEWCEIPE